MAQIIQKIRPFLWFDTQAEEAARFYVSVFGNSKLGKVSRYGRAGAKASGMPEGSVMTVEFRLDGQEFVALNGGPNFKFTEAISFVVNCRTQREVDKFWEAFSKGGQKLGCGWIKDKYGLCWQIVPTVLMEMLNDEDPEKPEKVMEAMLRMEKIDIKTLQEAYKQVGQKRVRRSSR